MASWADFASADPELSAFGQGRFEDTEVAYLATVDQHGAPRVHPVTPFIAGGKLFIFMDATSPKGADLRRGSRYALHSAVSDQDGGGGEFTVSGAATLVEDSKIRALASAEAPYTPADSYILFELSVDKALSTVYEQGQPKRRCWRTDRR